MTPRVDPPQWTRDLVIYEVNPRGFTSPNGSGDGDGSGTFASLADRLPYLARLGVTGLWLAGYCDATDHFYGVWSVYATVRPDVIDPALGTRDDLRDLVARAHSLGVRVFLDVISHGVMATSPLVADRPEFFEGGSWGMVDYDYANPGFRRWWVDVWTSYVLDCGVDGFRVDISLQDPSLWDEICERCSQSGHDIVVFPEGGRYHFSQADTIAFSPDVATDWEKDGTRFATVQVSSHDRGWLERPGNHYAVRGSRSRFAYSALLSHRIPLFFGGEEFDADPVALPKLARGLYGTGGPGGWMYGTQLQWQQASEPNRAAMLSDVTDLLRVRRENRDLLNADHAIGSMMSLPSTAPSLVPYARFVPGERAILVVANEEDVERDIALRVPLAAMGLGAAARLRLTDLVTGRSRVVAKAGFNPLRVAIGPDHQLRGGIRVLDVRPQ